MKVFLFILLVTSLVTSLAGAQSAPDIHLILVNGLAEKMIEPNMIVVNLESWAQAPTAMAAQEQQAAQYSKIKSAVDKFKIKKEDMQTVGYSVNPEYAYDQKAQVNRITGYRVSHTVAVIYRKTEDAGTFLDALVFSKGTAAGVNVQSVSWDSDKKVAGETEALGEAVKNARAKANELARAAGTEIRAVHRIQHTSETPPIARPMYAEAAMMKMSSDAAPSTVLSAGLIKVRVEVQMEFEIQ